ncbi:nitroreductase family deazaflavin-dependent oxidoreductase [Cryobacterium melibiosiphilum]|uniref:Nitroreductase family deazaflavin-dependent oxidoreductase n=1 Tax=Cryobacterium melibiosiphilum TaxID=995039 RepID=A0A3A5M7F4_9MICO|nr:nitroreductase family deazaflavin-dependent oxidoreductase [Cryobacterium melibiosiphilum]RJT84665.1 nitroreductase family deazaflavin-dependent oxidoreductase [Cryobacterium melibiosiphilum]
MTARTKLTDLSMKAMNGVHRALLRVSGGRIGWTIGTIPAVELHTIGRTSGQRRSTMLTAPVHDGDTYVLVASKGGDDRHPFWYQNLVANPEIELTVRGRTRPFRARTATSAEKSELWPRIVAAYSGYAAYQTKTSRDIPVVICEPRG